MARAARWLLFNLLAVALILGALEGAARLWLAERSEPLFSDPNLMIRDRPIVEPHERRGFALRAGTRGVAGWRDLRGSGPAAEPGKPLVIAINRAGFRGPEVPDGLFERFRIVALGDSTTFGWRLGNGEDYPARLGKALRGDGASTAYVINAGVPSYTSRQVLIYLQELLEGDIEPDLVLISVLWNDVWYSTVINWYPEILVYQQPAAWRLFLTRHSALLRRIMLRDAPRSKLQDIFNESAYQHYTNNVREMIAACAEHGVALALVEAPFALGHIRENGVKKFHVRYTKPYLVETARRYSEALRGEAKAHDVPVIAHPLALDALAPARLFVDAVHPTAEGSDLMARAIAAFLLERSLVARIGE